MKINSVEAVLDLIEDELNKKEIFFGMPIELVLKALSKLEEVGKA